MSDDFRNVLNRPEDADDKHRQWAMALRAAAAILESGQRVVEGTSETLESASLLESALWRIVDVAGEIATDPSVDHALACRFTGKGVRIEPRAGWSTYESPRVRPQATAAHEGLDE